MRHRLYLLCCLAAVTLLHSGCGGLFKRDPGPQLIVDKTAQTLHGREWELRAVTIDGNDVVMHVDSKMSLRFDADGQARGNGGVNQFSAGYDFGDDGILAWEGFTLKKQAGPPEFQEKEKIYLGALRRTTRAIAGKVMLTLQSDGGEVILTFLKPGTL
ncbi:MAG: META domain-containing protein [Burkholderiales bacterium]